MKRAKQILDYVSTKEEAILTYTAIGMILEPHSDAGYLKKLTPEFDPAATSSSQKITNIQRKTEPSSQLHKSSKM